MMLGFLSVDLMLQSNPYFLPTCNHRHFASRSQTLRLTTLTLSSTPLLCFQFFHRNLKLMMFVIFFMELLLKLVLPYHLPQVLQIRALRCKQDFYGLHSLLILTHCMYSQKLWMQCFQFKIVVWYTFIALPDALHVFQHITFMCVISDFFSYINIQNLNRQI